MRCDELKARLDAAGPGGLTRAQLAHARECETCAAELKAAQAIEAMLRTAAPSPSMTFTTNVMGRVQATERARQRLAELPRVPALQRWLRAVVDEPIAVAALALAPVPILVTLLWPGTASTLTAFLRDAFAAWITAANSGTTFAGGGIGEISSPMGTIANLLAVPVLIAIAVLGFQRAGEGLGGSLTSARRAHRDSTSRRKPS